MISSLVILLVIFFIPWFASIWVYRDAWKWRARGVPISPGLTTAGTLILFLVLSVVCTFFLNFFEHFVSMAESLFSYDRYGYGYHVMDYATGGFSMLIDLSLRFMPFWWYLYRRARMFPIMVANDPPPLPSEKTWKRWVFYIVFAAPLLFAIAVYLYLRIFWRGFGW